MDKKRIGELLVEEGYVTPEQVNQALEVQKQKKDRICNILMDLGFLSEDDFLEFLAAIPGMARIELERYSIDKSILDLIPAEMALDLEIVPIGKIKNLLTVAMVCPIDENAIERLADITGLHVKSVLCSKRAVYRALDSYYKKEREKPEEAIEPEDAVAAIEDSLILRGVAKLVENIEELPTLPDILGVIESVVNDPNSSADDLAKIISSDSALSGKVLKLANSAAFGFSRKVSSIKHAIALLGFRETQSLAVSVYVYDQLSGGEGDFNFKEYWNHSFACATLSRLIATEFKSSWIDVSYLAGLFHDIGRVAIAMAMKGKLNKAASLQSKRGISLIQAEEEALGITHAEAGYLLGEHWLLPRSLTNAIRHHHSPEEEPEPKGLAGIVFLANRYCDLPASQDEARSALDEDVYVVLQSLEKPDAPLLKALEAFDKIADDIAVF